MKKFKVVLTGGHAATTALATIEELIKKSNKDKEIDIYWIGSRSAIQGKNVETLEARIFPELGIKFHPIIMGRLPRRWSIWTIPTVAKIPYGFIHALYILIKIRPKIIVSFGGFAAFPIALMGWVLRIPVIIHEQTHATGLSNKIAAYFATKVAISREESRKHFPKNKIIITGLPIMDSIVNLSAKSKISNPPTLLIVGGSRGSQTINRAIFPIIGKLLKDFEVIHQTGELDFSEATKLRDRLDEKQKYTIYNLIKPEDIPSVYERSDIVIARGGANTVAELVYLKRPSIIIPISWARYDEQNKNANYAKSTGIAEVLDENTLTPEKLYEAINERKNNWSSIVKNANNSNVIDDSKASSKLVELIENYLK